MVEAFKTCSKCSKHKNINLFYNRKDTTDKKQSWCKECDNIKKNNYIANNKEKVALTQKQWVNKNKSRVLQTQQNWRKQNKARCVYHANKRRAAKLKATPKWADTEKIQQYYDFAAFMKWITLGIEYHVDHIIPLRGKNVCGLHVHENLQVLRKDQNLAKSNLFKE